ncbi:MAG: hypothetical protein ACXWE7_12000 [Nitrososphaeraceae archaeon]
MTEMITIQSKDCDCEFSVVIEYFYKSKEDVLTWNPSFYKDAKLIRICQYHEREARNNVLKKLKKEESKQAYLNAAPLLKDLASEIKIVRYSDYVLRSK